MLWTVLITVFAISHDSSCKPKATTSQPIIVKEENGKSYVQLRVNGKVIWAEVAITEAARHRGLMGRTKLKKDHGMLFVMPEDSHPSMWMKNTPLPLSCAFIRSDGVITQVFRMKPYSLHYYTSRWAVRYALEMDAGWFQRNDVHAGDRIEIPSILLKSHAPMQSK